MNLYEYESKILLNNYKIFIINSYLSKNFFFIKNYVYKIQVYSGYRKKNKGIEQINDFHLCLLFFKKWKTTYLFKKKIKNILIEKFQKFEKELYISLFIKNNNLNIIFSEKGGVEIENNFCFLKLKINFLLIKYSIFEYLSNCKINNFIIKKIIKILNKLYYLCIKKKIKLIEINPIVIFKNNVYILDCKIILEKKQLISFSDKISNFFKINYIQLKGNVCCIVNGAGLALYTLDYFNLNNEKCFNFIDLSGSIIQIKLNKLFLFLIVKKIYLLFINIFGGIVSCKNILFSILNLMYYNFKFKIIIKIDGLYSTFCKKKLINFKNLIIIEEFIDCVKNSIVLLNDKK